MILSGDGLQIICDKRSSDACYDYAAAELSRLLRRLECGPAIRQGLADGHGFHLQLAGEEAGAFVAADLAGIWPDGYVIQVTSSAICLSSPTSKGVLNAVYDLAERWGVVFLLPGEAGEWMPPSPASLPVGQWRVNPRFRHRGVFWEGQNNGDYTEEQWLRFYAKLRFNTVRYESRDLPLTEALGLRLEEGGHGLSKLLPRDLYATEPELFRMFQPEDFGGKRTADANLCVTNPRTIRLIQERFVETLEAARGVYAIHAWADDLPAGGWCLCASCRALAPTDQALLAMRHLAQVIAQSGLPIRLPVLAYHDTMMPGTQIDVPPEAFLLFAPRERCYAHGLDDPSCERNRFYLQSLKAWMEKFRGIDDAHTFEYYFDQILFRGMYPFIPEVILEDMRVYEAHGIESMISLQVGGPAIAPELNMLVFAKGQWDATLTAEQFIANLAQAIHPEAPSAWSAYLTQRAHAFAAAMRMCDHQPEGWMDYRWLPETVSPFGAEMVRVYAASAEALDDAAKRLTDAMDGTWPERVRALARCEVGRARFEAAELRAMSYQQDAMNHLAHYWNSYSQETLSRGIEAMEKTVQALGTAREKAQEAGLPKKAWYFGNINAWLTKELNRKIADYRQAPGSAPAGSTAVVSADRA